LSTRASARSPASSTTANHSPLEDPVLQEKLQNLENDLALATQKESEIAQERDFYFSKLREIELLCQQDGIKETWEIMQGVENILYASTEEDGTQARLAALEGLSIGRDEMSHG
jgi:microtubule-associated protein, RP/EB family